jgi:hypothetical protein
LARRLSFEEMAPQQSGLFAHKSKQVNGIHRQLTADFHPGYSFFNAMMFKEVQSIDMFSCQKRRLSRPESAARL